MAISTDEHSRWFHKMGPKVPLRLDFMLFIFYFELSCFFFLFFSAYPVNILHNPIGTFPHSGESTQPDGLKRGVEADIQTHPTLCGYVMLRLLLLSIEKAIECRI